MPSGNCVASSPIANSLTSGSTEALPGIDGILDWSRWSVMIASFVQNNFEWKSSKQWHTLGSDSISSTVPVAVAVRAGSSVQPSSSDVIERQRHHPQSRWTLTTRLQVTLELLKGGQESQHFDDTVRIGTEHSVRRTNLCSNMTMWCSGLLECRLMIARTERISST